MARRYFSNDLSLIRSLPKLSLAFSIIAAYAIFDFPVYLYNYFVISIPRISIAYGCGAAFISIVVGLYGLSLQHNDDIWEKRCALLGASISCMLIGWVGWVLFA